MAFNNPTRRNVMFGLGATLGTTAFNAMLAAEKKRTVAPSEKVRGSSASPLAPKPSHVKGKAKACIYVMLAGGPSHIDTFDPKPKLKELHLKEFRRTDKFASAMASGKRYYVQSPFNFIRAGKSGLPMNEHFRNLAGVADELCVYHGCEGESINHPTAMYHMNTGNRFGGDPAMGAWVNYGLGSVNSNLPGFVVLPEVAYPQGGAANWSNGFLPAHYQGTPLRAAGSPILNLTPPRGVTREHQRKNLDLLSALNAGHQKQHAHHDELSARMASYELAYRMQMQVPDLIDLKQESEKTREMYGVGGEFTDSTARQCLLARRMIERGVRFVQMYVAGWDSHDYIERAHRRRIWAIDQPVAAMIKDLKQRGMLDDTLVIIGGEFGRSPDNGVRGGGVKVGRDHNAKAMNIVLAGGGVKAGHSVGATNEIGDHATEVVHPIKDLHVTYLRMLGLDDNKLTYFHGGRFKQLSQTGGQLIREIMA